MKQLNYTADEINSRLGKVSTNESSLEDIESKLSNIHAVLIEMLNKGVFLDGISTQLYESTSTNTALCGSAICGYAICGTN